MHMRTKGRVAGLAFLAATGLLTGVGPAPAPALQTADATASPEALDSLDLFLAHALNGDGKSRPGTGLKIEIQFLDGWRDTAWLSSFARTADGFEGVLADNAHIAAGGAGDTVNFTRSAIHDWHLTSAEGLSYGAFTTRAARARLTQEQARALESTFTEAPLPPNW